MRREVDNFDYGWMNDQSTFYLNVFFVNGMWIKVNNDYLCFNIELDKETLTYIIKHSIKLSYPWCGTSTRLECGKYKTYKDESKKSREIAVKKLILDWFVGMYGSDDLLKRHFGDDYILIKDKLDTEYTQVWGEYFKITQDAMRKFAEDFCLT